MGDLVRSEERWRLERERRRDRDEGDHGRDEPHDLTMPRGLPTTASGASKERFERPRHEREGNGDRSRCQRASAGVVNAI